MTTEVKRFKDAYATLTFAVYEPLILRWYSGLGIMTIADGYAKRATPAAAGATRVIASAMTVSEAARESKPLVHAVERLGEEGYLTATTGGLAGSPLFSLSPKLEVTPGLLYLGGRMEVVELLPVDGPSNGAKVRQEAPPILFESGAQPRPMSLDPARLTVEIVDAYKNGLDELIGQFGTIIPGSEVKKMIVEQADLKLAGHGAKVGVDILMPEGELLEFLSPIGVAHFYRQLYFYLAEGVGPIEQAFTVAPKETLEVVTETVRRQSHEEVYEHGSEVVSESAVESRNVDEVSDKVASMVERDTSIALSTNTSFEASGGVGVWNFGASASLGLNSTMDQSSQNSTEIAKRRLKEVTKRAAERITKTYSLRVRDTVDFTTTNVQRRVLQNETAKPVSYGLRRVYNRVTVKVQSLGPNLVWQLYISRPGDGLARSRFVHFGEAQPIAPINDPPAIRPQPTGGIESGTVSAQLKRDTTKPLSDPMAFFVTLVIQVPPDRQIAAVSIESMTDLEHLAKEDLAPSPSGGSLPGVLANGVYTIKLGVLPGDAESVSVTYQYRWDPSQAAIDAWTKERDEALSKLAKQDAAEREKALREQFERQKGLITERSKIRPRAAADLRKEERYEVLNRMISHLFRPKGKGSQGAPAPLEIELFHRYFDVDAMFVFLHPSWWVPRFAGKETGFGRPQYEITADSEPAAMGKSLGWLMQLDGDVRRNEFINSPWVRTCLPIRQGREREAIAWLAEHIEGDLGYDTGADPLKGLIEGIEKVRKNQAGVIGTGPDYVDATTSVVTATPGAPSGPLKPENVYPVIDEFDVTVPSEGFVYDDLIVVIP